MKKIALIISLSIICFCTSCKKNEEKEVTFLCWVSSKGDFLNTGRTGVGGSYCDLTEEEFLNCTTCGWNGRVRDFVTACDYYQSEGPNIPKLFHWEVKFVGTTTYTGDYFATEKEASCYLGANGTLYRKK